MSNNRTSSKSVIKQIFEGYIEDTISDEQIRRILEPVLKLINEGAFDKPRGLFGSGIFSLTRSIDFLFQKRAN